MFNHLLHYIAASALIVASLPTSLAQDVTLNPVSNRAQASRISPLISPSYAGMGIEPSNLLSFTGTNQVNQLTFQLLRNLANYTGVPPHLRIGGNTGDNMLYSQSVTAFNLQRNPSSSGQGYTQASDYFLFGPNYFAAMDRLPEGTPVTYGLNLAYTGSDYSSLMVNQANAAFENLRNVTLVGIEIGNEPDLYIQNGYRSSSWSVQDYGGEWSTRAKTLYEQVLRPRNISTNFFEPAVTATTAAKAGQPFRIANLVNTQVAFENGIYVAGWNQHNYFYFVGVSTFELTTDILLDLSRTKSQFNEWSQQAEQAQVTGKPYYLREMGSVGPTGIQGISDTFANTLWTLNFFLFAATQQVSSVQMHLTDNSYGSPWQPVTINGVAPHVRSSYYAWAAFDQLVGASCNTRIATLDVGGVPGNYNNRLGAYSAYRGDDLTSIVMINTQTAYASTTNKPSVNFTFRLPSLAGQTLYLHTLTAAGADSTTNTTWNGISYEVSGTGAPTFSSNTTLAIQIGSDGSVSIPVRDSQAVIANIGFQLGREEVDQQSCNLLATSTPEGGENSANGTVVAAPAPTFKSTTGFKNNGPALSLGAIIGISAGGGVFVIIVLALLIWLCVRSSRKRRRRAMATMPPPRPDHRPLLGRDGLPLSKNGSPAYSTLSHGTPRMSQYGPLPMAQQHMSTPPQRFKSTVPAMDDNRSMSSRGGHHGRAY